MENGKLLDLLTTSPVEQLRGIIGGWFDLNCDIKAVENGFDVYYCSEEDYMFLSPVPTMKVYGDQAQLAHILLQHLLFVPATVGALTAVESLPPGTRRPWINLLEPFSYLYGKANALKYLDLIESDSGVITCKADEPKE